MSTQQEFLTKTEISAWAVLSLLTCDSKDFLLHLTPAHFKLFSGNRGTDGQMCMSMDEQTNKYIKVLVTLIFINIDISKGVLHTLPPKKEQGVVILRRNLKRSCTAQANRRQARGREWGQCHNTCMCGKSMAKPINLYNLYELLMVIIMKLKIQGGLKTLQLIIRCYVFFSWES
jgi:hypothetical protein